jgi:hypothetical protein
MREYPVRICEGLGVKFPGPTRQSRKLLHSNGMSDLPSTTDLGELHGQVCFVPAKTRHAVMQVARHSSAAQRRRNQASIVPSWRDHIGAHAQFAASTAVIALCASANRQLRSEALNACARQSTRRSGSGRRSLGRRWRRSRSRRGRGGGRSCAWFTATVHHAHFSSAAFTDRGTHRGVPYADAIDQLTPQPTSLADLNDRIVRLLKRDVRHTLC